MSITAQRLETRKEVAPNAFGHFRADGREFVITDLATPVPWVNVMSNGSYGLAVSQAGGGFSWGDNCQTSRISRWMQDLVEDRQGRFVYIQDLESPQEIWSTSLQPTMLPSPGDCVIHGLGYSVFERDIAGIRSEHTIFVSKEAPCEIWRVK